jgi:hypothetical protein
MTKLCAVCNAENRDEAQFCRACGSAFVALTGHGSFGDEPSAENICSECGFRNKPGIRYCANCGMNLAGASDVAPLGDLAPTLADVDAGSSPPPISYASFATVEPYPTAPAVLSGYPALLEDTTPLDIPDPDATIALRQQEAYGAPPLEFMEATASAAPNQAKRVVAGVIAGLVVAAIAAWTFLGRESSAPPVTAIAPAAVPAPPPLASAAAPIIVEAPATAAPPASAVVESAPLATPAESAAAPATPPAAAAPLPSLTDPVTVEGAANAEAKRIAAEKARRDKAARDKAERDAKAKALADQRDQAAAAARAEQDAQARRRAEEAQRARPVVTPVASAPATTQPRGVLESCAGRGTIAEAVCQSRLCSAAEHANEPICRQIREADERRRNLLN